MHPVLLSLLLGSTAAAANVFGGTIIVKRNWDRSYLKYFVALGAGFMLATAMLEIIPASFDLRERDAPFLILAGYLITHFFEHTVTPHFHFVRKPITTNLSLPTKAIRSFLDLSSTLFLTESPLRQDSLFQTGWVG